MAKRYPDINKQVKKFIQQQKIYFVATATADSHINLSPKGMDSFKIINKNTIVWLNLTGSGNETAAHLQSDPRMTIMFTAFEGDPMIVRLYGKATSIHHKDADWNKYYRLFKPLASARQIFLMPVDLVQTSCGMSTPFFEFKGERTQLLDWANKLGEKGIKQYWRDKNQISLDDELIHIVEKNIE